MCSEVFRLAVSGDIFRDKVYEENFINVKVFNFTIIVIVSNMSSPEHAPPPPRVSFLDLL